MGKEPQTKVLYVSTDGKYRYQLRKLDSSFDRIYMKELCDRLNPLLLDEIPENKINEIKQVINNYILSHSEFVSEDPEDFRKETFIYS